MRVLSERLKIIQDLEKEKAIRDYRQLLIKDLCIHFGEEEDTEEDLIEREKSFATFDTKELEGLLQDAYENEPELLSPESLSNSSSPPISVVQAQSSSQPMAENSSSSSSSSSSADQINGEEQGPVLITTTEEKAAYEAERQQILILISAHDPSLAQTLARLVTGRVNLIIEFERISGHKYVKILPFPTTIQSQPTAGSAAASIINSGFDNFGKSTRENNDDNNIEDEGKEDKTRSQESLF